MKPSPTIPPDEWGAQNRFYPETAGVPGPRDPFLTPYMVRWTREIWSGDHKRCVAITGAQSGKTDSILDAIGTRLDQKPAPILYVGPTREFLTDQFEPRLMGLLDEADTLKKKVVRGRRMKKTLKIVNGVRIRLAHAGSSTALKSDPAALAFIDEYDEMSKSVKGQGDVLGLVEARGVTYSDFRTAVTSTPSKGSVHSEFDPVSGLEFWAEAHSDDLESPIWRLWQEGTRYHYAWPCPHCDDFFIPRFKTLRWPERSTPAQAKRETYMECPHCHALIEDDKHKAEMNARGVYVAPGQRIEKDGTVVGDPPESSTYSVWISGLASPFVSWGQRVESYLTALSSGDPDRIQTAMNAGFGELFSMNATGDAPEWQEVLDKRLSYRLRTVPEDVLRIVMGVDVQKVSLYYTIRGYGARGTSWLLDAGQIYGRTDDETVWSSLAEVMLTPIEGRYVERVLIDSGFRPNKADGGDEHKVYEFCRRFQWIAFPTKGRDQMNPPYRISKIETRPDGKRASYATNLILLSTDFFKSLVLSRIRTQHGQAGAFYVPDDVSEDYCKQLVSEVRTVNYRNGKAIWIARSRQNHFFDCEALCAAAAHTMNVQRIPEVAREGSTGDVPPIDVSADASGDAPERPPIMAGVSVSARNRFADMASRFNR